MPTNSITYQSPALMPAPEGSLTTLIITNGSLVQGDNVLAVEVHQNRPESDDVVFGLALSTLVPIPLPILLYPRIETNLFAASVPTAPGPTYHLQYSRLLGTFADWRDLQTFVGNGTLITVTDGLTNTASRFYRLKLDQ